MLGEKLGLRLYGKVSVMVKMTFKCTVRGLSEKFVDTIALDYKSGRFSSVNCTSV